MPCHSSNQNYAKLLEGRYSETVHHSDAIYIGTHINSTFTLLDDLLLDEFLLESWVALPLVYFKLICLK